MIRKRIHSIPTIVIIIEFDTVASCLVRSCVDKSKPPTSCGFILFGLIEHEHKPVGPRSSTSLVSKLGGEWVDRFVLQPDHASLPALSLGKNDVAVLLVPVRASPVGPHSGISAEVVNILSFSNSPRRHISCICYGWVAD